MPRTISTTDQLLRAGSHPEVRHRALELLLALAAVECHVSTGGPASRLPGLLRAMVIATARLVGGAWLDANAEEAASFVRLQTSLHAPPMPEIDQLLACLLSDRFGLSRPDATANAAPTWICLLRRVNLGLEHEQRSGRRQRPAS